MSAIRARVMPTASGSLDVTITLVSGLALRVIAVCVVLVGGAGAAPPSGYSCGDGGKPIKGQGCQCPAGKAPARDGENTAVCVAKAQPKVEPDQPTAANACMKDRKGRYQVKIDSTPGGATVYIGDKSCGIVGYTPWTGLSNAGPAVVIVEKDGHNAVTRTIDGKTAKAVAFSLSKTSTSVGISSHNDKNVEGAEASIDGLVIGTAPIVKLVTPGRHLIELKKPGFEPFSQWIEAPAGQRSTISPTLKAVAGARSVTQPNDEVTRLIALIEKQPDDLDRSTWKEKRRDAARRLIKIGDRRAVPILIQLAETEPFDIIGDIAIEGLGTLGDRTAISPLTKISGDSARDRGTRELAAKALAKLQ